MKIVVTVKLVPDTTAPKKIDPSSLRLSRTATTVLNPFDEYALEAALKLREANVGTTITALAMAPESAREALRKTLGMGADEVVLLSDPQLQGADARATSIALSAALRYLKADLVLTGMTSSDAGGGYMSAMIAERLGYPSMLGMRSLTVWDRQMSGERLKRGLLQQLEATLPLVVSVTKEFGVPRYPSLKNIMAAKNKPFTIIDLQTIGLNSVAVAPSLSVRNVTPRGQRTGATIITPSDAPAAAREILSFLRARKVPRL